MAKKKALKVHNKSDKPDNIVIKDNEIIEKCIEIEQKLPEFIRDYFLYLKSAVALSTRLAYLNDILFFFNYIISHSNLSNATNLKEVTAENFDKITAKDINRYLADYCARYTITTKEEMKIMENRNRSLARKKASLSILFKFLYRDEIIKQNITDGFNPIRLPKPQPDAIKRLEIDEVAKLIDHINNGDSLSEKEKVYWRKTRLRDKAIILLFVTYGLRLSELQQLNISSFNFNRGEFMIYRKRGKEVLMPINKTCEIVIKEYIENERPRKEQINKENFDALFLSLQKKRMASKTIRNLIKKHTAIILGTSTSSGYSPHKLRATAATSLIQQGFSIYDVQNLLDHDNVTTTQLYAAHKKNVKREIVKNFEWLD